MGFDYFYGRGTEQFAFYQVPKMLITDDRFAGITMDSKSIFAYDPSGKVAEAYESLTQEVLKYDQKRN